MNERVRKVDLKKLSLDQADEVASQLGDKVREICEEAVAKANRLLEIYGMSAKMQIVIGEQQKEIKKARKKIKEASSARKGE